MTDEVAALRGEVEKLRRRVGQLENAFMHAMHEMSDEWTDERFDAMMTEFMGGPPGWRPDPEKDWPITEVVDHLRSWRRAAHAKR